MTLRLTIMDIGTATEVGGVLDTLLTCVAQSHSQKYEPPYTISAKSDIQTVPSHPDSSELQLLDAKLAALTNVPLVLEEKLSQRKPFLRSEELIMLFRRQKVSVMKTPEVDRATDALMGLATVTKR